MTFVASRKIVFFYSVFDRSTACSCSSAFSIFQNRSRETLFLPLATRILLPFQLIPDAAGRAVRAGEFRRNYSRYHVRCNHVTQPPTKRFRFLLFFSPVRRRGNPREGENSSRRHPARNKLLCFLICSSRRFPLSVDFQRNNREIRV